MTFRYTNKNTDSFNKINGYSSNPVKDKKFYCAKGDSFMLKSEYKNAVNEYLLSLMIDKNNPRAAVGASKAYKNLQKYDKAIKHLKNAKKLSCFDSEIYYELGLNYLLNADSINAQKNFIRTIKLKPDDKNAQLKLALTHELSGEADMAILVYKTIIEKNPDYIPAMYNLAGLYIEHENFNDAIVLFKKMLKINPLYYRAFLGLGLCFDKLKQYTNAVRFYKKYIFHKPKSDTTKSLVGRIYEIHKTKCQNTKSKGGELRIVSKSREG